LPSNHHAPIAAVVPEGSHHQLSKGKGSWHGDAPENLANAWPSPKFGYTAPGAHYGRRGQCQAALRRRQPMGGRADGNALVMVLRAAGERSVNRMWSGGEIRARWAVEGFPWAAGQWLMADGGGLSRASNADISQTPGVHVFAPGVAPYQR